MRRLVGLLLASGCGFTVPGVAGTPDDARDAAAEGAAIDPDAHVDAAIDGPPAVGKLVGSATVTTAIFDLTTEGTIDWGEWGMTQTGDFIRKAGGGNVIPNVTVIGGGAYVGYGNSYMQAG